MSSTVILASGLADLATAIAALTVHGAWPRSDPSRISVILVGHRVSLPDNLANSFRKAAAQSFNFSDIEVFRWGEDQAELEAFSKSRSGADVVVANQLQDPRQRALVAALRPRQFIFYDNGLSSYSEHDVDLVSWAGELVNCRHFFAYLSYSDVFGDPAYLRPFQTTSLSPSALSMSMAEVRKGCVPLTDQLPEGAVVILGTSFDRTNIISASDELRIHQELLAVIGERHGGPIYFKPHPRANQTYLGEADGVIPLSAELPVEAFVSSSDGTAYSFSSTALFSLPEMFGWDAYRVQHPLMERVFDARPQLAKIKVLAPSLVLEMS